MSRAHAIPRATRRAKQKLLQEPVSNVLFVVLSIAILSVSPKVLPAEAGPWDEDTTDDLAWEKSARLLVRNPEGLARDNEVIQIQLGELGLPANVDWQSLRLIDPTAPPDEPNEVNGNDIPIQIDDLDSNGVPSKGDELVFQLSLDANEDDKILLLYYNRLTDAPTKIKAKTYATDLKCSAERTALRLANTLMSCRITSHIESLAMHRKPLLRTAYWYLAKAIDGEPARSFDAPVKFAEIQFSGPVRVVGKLLSSSDYAADPERVMFENVYEIYAHRGELRVSTRFRLPKGASARPTFILHPVPGGTFKVKRTSYAYGTLEGRVHHAPYRAEQRRYDSNNAIDWTDSYDPELQTSALGIFAPNFLNKFTFSAPLGRTYVSFIMPPLIPGFSEQRLSFSIYAHGGESGLPYAPMERFSMCARRPLEVFIANEKVFPRLPEPPGEQKLLKVDPSSFQLWLKSTDPDLNARACSNAPNRGGDWVEITPEFRTEGFTVFDVPFAKRVLDSTGTVKIQCEPACNSAYLLAKYRTVPSVNKQWLKQHALAYAEPYEPAAEFTISPTSHRVEIAGHRGAIESLKLDGQEFLSSGVITSCRKRPCEVTGRTEDSTKLRDVLGNQISVNVTPRGDRLRIICLYKVTSPRDTHADVRVTFPLKKRIRSVQGLCWETTEQSFIDQEQAESNVLMPCQTPFCVARMEDGSYIAVFDFDQANIVFETSRKKEHDELSVAYWAWPKVPGQVYEWTFELIPGYGTFPNALLRAAHPHTRDFKDVFKGAMSYLHPAASEQAREAYEQGVRAIYYHGWFHRNGRYLPPGFAPDAEYLRVNDKPMTLAQVMREIKNATDAHIKICGYTQFTGISEDIAPDFASSLIRDEEGQQKVVGEDGNYKNIWANPNPNLPYGRTYLQQAEQMLTKLGFSGIAMDRTDRLDNRHGWGLFDLAHFDGSACPFLHDGKHLPCSSIALQGKRFLTQIRRILDKHNAYLIANLPRSFFVFRMADAVKADIKHSPWDLFFLKALSNGKTMFAHDRPYGPMQSEASDFLARLCQCYPVISSNPRHPRYRVDLDGPHGRLLYVIPTDGYYPTHWVFEDQISELRYDPGPPRTLLRYAGSQGCSPSP